MRGWAIIGGVARGRGGVAAAPARTARAGAATPFMAGELAAGALRALDKAKLPNLKNLDPSMLALAAQADPGNAHGAPYLWSVTGIGYDEALVDKALGEGTGSPRDTLALLFDPELAKKLASCG